MFRNVIRTIAIIIVFAVFMLTGIYIGGRYEQSEQAREAAKEQTIETIAVVNLDEGTVVEGKTVNYSTELLSYPDVNFMAAGLEEARNGINTGAYAAYVIIPATFSESVESINASPKKANLEYAINPNLREETKTKIVYDIQLFQEQMNGTLSYVYVTSIMEEFHDVQDSSKIILKNDKKDLNTITEIKPEEITTDLEFSEMVRTENTLDYVDLSDYYEDNFARAGKITDIYHETMDQARDEFRMIQDKGAVSDQAIDDMMTYMSGMDPLADENGNLIYEAGLEKLDQQLLLSEPAQSAKIDELKTNIRLEIGFWRLKQQTYIDTKLTQIQEANQQQVDELFGRQQENIRTQYEQIKGNVENQVSGNSIVIDWPDAPALSGNIVLKTAVSGNTEGKSAENQVWISLSENTISANAIESVSANDIPLNHVEMSDGLKSRINEVMVDKDKLQKIIEEDIVNTVLGRLDEAAAGVGTKYEVVSEAVMTHQEEIMKFDPFEKLDKNGIDDRINAIGNNIMDMEDDIGKTTSEYIDYVDTVYTNTEENIGALQEDMKASNDATEEKVNEVIHVLKESRETINYQNDELLSGFTQKLAYTRLGSLENSEAYDFIVTPVIFQEKETPSAPIVYLRQNYDIVILSVIAGLLTVCIAIFVVDAVYGRKTR
ncbi:MAG: hypothetical protein QM697_09905 [Lachnospiraceae bacterium]